jgi:hypothetical protein
MKPINLSHPDFSSFEYRCWYLVKESVDPYIISSHIIEINHETLFSQLPTLNIWVLDFRVVG